MRRFLTSITPKRKQCGNAGPITASCSGQFVEVTHDQWGWEWLENLFQDLHFGIRMLRKSPGFTTVAVLTLALGIGANAAIFSVVNAVLLRPLPYKHADRIVWAAERFAFLRGSATVMSPDFIPWCDRNRTFETIDAFVGSAGANLTGSSEPQRVSVIRVTPGFFTMLGVEPLIGRFFLPDEGKEARSHVALLSETVWRERFGGDKRILGKTVDLDGTPYAVVGVMPASVRYPGADL
jgi:MacB-like periplasmic core domain